MCTGRFTAMYWCEKLLLELLSTKIFINKKFSHINARTKPHNTLYLQNIYIYLTTSTKKKEKKKNGIFSSVIKVT